MLAVAGQIFRNNPEMFFELGKVSSSYVPKIYLLFFPLKLCGEDHCK